MIRRCTICGYTWGSDIDEAIICPACHAVSAVDRIEIPKPSPTADEKDKTVSAFVKWADMLDDDTLLRLGRCSKSGLGMRQNFEDAVTLFQTLAYRGNLDGMYELGQLYLETSPNREKALFWLKEAVAGGHEGARLRLKELGEAVETFRSRTVATAELLPALVRDAAPNVLSIRTTKGQGAGFIVEGGYVVTNAHVVADDKNNVYGYFKNDTPYPLTALSVVCEYDVAVLEFTDNDKKKFEQNGLQLDCRSCLGGESVYTIGNPLGYSDSVAKGIISNPERKGSKWTDDTKSKTYGDALETTIQTDISANHGNSGGPLLDMDNRVLGIVSSIPEETDGGIALCVPSKYIVKVLNQL